MLQDFDRFTLIGLGVNLFLCLFWLLLYLVWSWHAFREYTTKRTGLLFLIMMSAATGSMLGTLVRYTVGYWAKHTDYEAMERFGHDPFFLCLTAVMLALVTMFRMSVLKWGNPNEWEKKIGDDTPEHPES